jgi:hypothetical protein
MRSRLLYADFHPNTAALHFGAAVSFAEQWEPHAERIAMARSITRTANTLTRMWWETAFKVWETAVASPQVIAHRTARMAVAGALPDPADRKEFTGMVQEKAEASAEAARGMALEVYRINQQLGYSAMQHWMRAWTGALTPSSRRMTTPLVSPIQAAVMTSRVVAKGLAPVHRRATANAKRLRRVKKR